MRSYALSGFTGAAEATGLLADVRSTLARLIRGEYWKLSGDELLDIGRELEQLARLLWAAQIHLVDEINQQHLATTLGATSTAALLRDAFRLTPGEASLRVRAAAALLPQDQATGGSAPARRPALATALDGGDITGPAVDAALRMFRRLPDAIPADVLAEAEQTLVDHARTEDPTVYRRIVDHLEAVLHPDGPAPDDPAVHDRMELRIGVRNRTTGLTSLRGWLDDPAVATLRAVTDPLAAPRPSTDGLPDNRAAATRTAHALTEALTFVLRHSADVLPDARQERPHITVTLDWNDLRRQSARLGQPDLTPGQARQLLCDADVRPRRNTGTTPHPTSGASRRRSDGRGRRGSSYRNRTRQVLTGSRPASAERRTDRDLVDGDGSRPAARPSPAGGRRPAGRHRLAGRRRWPPSRGVVAQWFRASVGA